MGTESYQNTGTWWKNFKRDRNDKNIKFQTVANKIKHS